MKKQLSNLEVDMYGTKSWWINGKLHRDNDLPAVEWKNGEKEWYKNGVKHRDNNLPAVEYFDGHKAWYLNGVCYRIDDWIYKL